MRLIAFAFLMALQGSFLHPALAQGSDEDAAPMRESITLDTLFAQLRRQPQPAAASRIARQIWSKWTDSGSDSIDLLMEWSAKAMEERKYAVAEDLLTQITVLAPDFAEGWNRRATLYFLMSDYGRSISDIERTLQLEPRHFGALSGLGSILDRTGSQRKALQTWYKILAIYPANRRAQEAVVKLEELLAGEAS